MSSGFGSVAFFILLLAAIAVFFPLRWINRPSGPFVTVFEWEYGICYVDGRFDRILPPGRYFSWRPARRVVYRLRRTDQLHTTLPIDVTSADKLVFRLGAILTYRFADPREAFENSYLEKLNLAAMAALPKIATARTLEVLLSERATLDAELLSVIGSPTAGCEIVAATISAMILPPEVRRLLSEVERARLESVAALERARGEQASLRSLANSARMLKGNPELMNLRVLQAVSGRGQTSLVLGSNAILPVSPSADAQTTES